MSDIPGNECDGLAMDEGDMQAMAVMTLRDVFAAFAIQGLLASYAGIEDADIQRPRCARWAYNMADDMLRERMKL